MLYSMSTQVHQPGTATALRVTARLDLYGSGRRTAWWFVAKVNGRRAGDAARFPLISRERPPLEAARREVVKRVAGVLNVDPRELVFTDDLMWREGSDG